MKPRPGSSLPEKFWRRVVTQAGARGCWLFVSPNMNYGQFFIDGRIRPAHRLTYEDAIGPIPDGLQIDHLCRVRCCVNPAHLEAVTPSENCFRAWEARRSPGKLAAESRRDDLIRETFGRDWQTV